MATTPDDLAELCNQELGALEALMDDPNNVDALKALQESLWDRVARLEDRVLHWFESYEETRAKYVAMRRERNEAMEQWLSYMEHQWAVERHLEQHEDDVRLKVRNSSQGERDRVARRLAEIFEMWDLKNGVEAEDLGETSD